MLDPAPLAIHGPADLLTAIPYILGYHPQNRVVVFITNEGRLTCGLSVDRQTPDAVIVAQSSSAASHANARTAVVVGYGPLSDRHQIARVADKINVAVTVQACLLVDGGRYYCLVDGCLCTPEHGAVLETASSVIAAEMTLLGRPVLASREHFDALLEPDTDAQARTAAAMASLPKPPTEPVTIVRSSLEHASAGERLSDEQAAYLAVALSNNEGRSTAWEATTGEIWQQDLWLDLARRVPEHCVAVPANLLAWSAWRRSEPALAWAALSKAIHAMPDNAMSHLIGILLASGINPATLPWPLPDGTDLEDLLR
ncbi:hypothetical protein Ahu01nite_079410 [Winogradskya humida]|uniref:DUF4192 family protein n=1 Tax=Winogradskya humida TaxID=113566 RepID=A0ABQ4A1V4_9ACTN|nr:hypothetical protein Ahu01nite_079410 [Actinoplanes humidus]